MVEFTWMPIYKEIATKLIDYENKQNELIDILKDIKKDNLPIISLNDKNINDKLIPLKEIDPFTFFANWNRGLTDENRKKILIKLKDVFKLKSEIPEDFYGIPVVNIQSAWFFGWKKDRKKKDIPLLWELFKEAVAGKLTSNTFNAVLKIRSIKYNITMGLFWINPEKYLNLDAVNRDYLKKNNIVIDKLKDFDSYCKILEDVNNKINLPFYELSYKSWIYKQKDNKPINGKDRNVKEIHERSPRTKNTSPLNIILYGPPGTGKTYYTVNHALSIIEGRDLTEYENIERAELHRKFEEYKEDGQIEFVTFHQSFSYEDFIEGIKPVSIETNDDKPGELRYEIQDGVFKYMCQKAQAEYHRENGAVYDFDSNKIDFYKMSLGGIYRPDIHEWCIDNNCLAIGWGEDNDFSSLKKYSNWEDFRDYFKKEFPELVKENRYVIQAIFIFMKMKEGDIVLVSKGNAKIDAIGKVTGSYEFNNDTPIDFYQFRKVEWLVTNLDSPADLFVKKKLSQQAIYEFYKGDVKIDYLKQMLGSKKTNDHNYVLIIDEINRGNVANIFGELITLIEDDKRRGMVEELSTTLPYSKKEFWVPSNLHIIGTMNTADRSVEALDTALRRRFSFIEMRPDVDNVKNPEGLEIDLKKMMERINIRIEALLDKDHCIGHSYFMGLDESKNPENDLKQIFKDKIIPLLEEYFYCDPVKIGMVLGQSFVENNNHGGNMVGFAPGFENELDDFDEKQIYKINNPLEFKDLEPFKRIYEK